MERQIMTTHAYANAVEALASIRDPDKRIAMMLETLRALLRDNPSLNTDRFAFDISTSAMRRELTQVPAAYWEKINQVCTVPELVEMVGAIGDRDIRHKTIVYMAVVQEHENPTIDTNELLTSA